MPSPTSQERGVELQSSLERKGKESAWLLNVKEQLGSIEVVVSSLVVTVAWLIIHCQLLCPRFRHCARRASGSSCEKKDHQEPTGDKDQQQKDNRKSQRTIMVDAAEIPGLPLMDSGGLFHGKVTEYELLNSN